MALKNVWNDIPVVTFAMLVMGIGLWAMLLADRLDGKYHLVGAASITTIIVGGLALMVVRDVKERRGALPVVRGIRARIGIALLGTAVLLAVPCAASFAVLTRANQNTEFKRLKDKYFQEDNVCDIAMAGGRSADLRIAANCARGHLAERSTAVFGSLAAIVAWLGLWLRSRRLG